MKSVSWSKGFKVDEESGLAEYQNRDCTDSRSVGEGHAAANPILIYPHYRFELFFRALFFLAVLVFPDFAPCLFLIRAALSSFLPFYRLPSSHFFSVFLNFRSRFVALPRRLTYPL